MLSRFTFVLIAILAVTTPSLAKDVQVGSVTITMPPPPGFCDADEKNPYDADLIKAIGGLLAQYRINLLSVAAECSQLADWRSGKAATLDDYVQYQAQIASNAPRIDRAEFLKQVCEKVGAQAGGIIADKFPDIKARMEEAVKGAKFNENQFIGVFKSGPEACYFGMVQKLQTDAGKEKTQVAVSTVTIVKGKVINYNLYTVYRDAGTVTAAFARHERNVSAFLLANGEDGGKP
jgi:hypothetical protein